MPDRSSSPPGLQPSELAVLRALDVTQHSGRPWQSPAEVAIAAGCDRRTAASALRVLRHRELAQTNRGRWKINERGWHALSPTEVEFVRAGRS